MEMRLDSAIQSDQPREIFLRVFAEMKPRTKPPAVAVEFRRFANANSFIRLEDAQLTVRISDVLQEAPAAVLEALAHILLSKLLKRPVPPAYLDRYRRYLNRKETRRNLHAVRRERGRKFLSGPQGECYDLEQMFEDLNFRFFHGLMARPALGWSRRVSRLTLGHYDPSHHAIILSKLLDAPGVPRLATEYVLFHEMLHLRHPVEHRGARRRVHTPEFKAAEKQFPNWKQAQEILRKL
jgi:hypothetical protein